MDTTDPTTAVLATVARYFDAINAHDLDAVSDVFSDSATLMANEVESVLGATAIREAYAQRFTIFDYARELHVDDCLCVGEVAVVRCHTTGSFTLRESATRVEGVSRELFVLRPTDAGWKIHVYMFNRTSPPPG